MVFAHLDFNVNQNLILKVTSCQPGAIEFVLLRLREKLEQALQEGRFKPSRRRSRSAASRGKFFLFFLIDILFLKGILMGPFAFGIFLSTVYYHGNAVVCGTTFSLWPNNMFVLRNFLSKTVFLWSFHSFRQWVGNANSAFKESTRALETQTVFVILLKESSEEETIDTLASEFDLKSITIMLDIFRLRSLWFGGSYPGRVQQRVGCSTTILYEDFRTQRRIFL